MPTIGVLACLAAFVLAWSTMPSTQTNVYFRADFNTESSLYNFANRFPQYGWRVEHLATGGWNGTGAPHIVMRAGQTQYQFGYETGPLKQTFSLGDGVYFRFRIKYDSTMRVREHWGNKFVMMGRTRTSPNSRIIIYMQTVNDSSGCSLGMQDYSGRRSTVFPWASPRHFGIRGETFMDDRLYQYAWSLAPYVNIGWDCGPPIFQTTPENPLKGSPGPNSETPLDGWYHVQVYAQSGGPGKGLFRTWANNNNLQRPTTERIGLKEGLGVEGWSNGAQIGGYMDNDTPSVDLGYTLDDFEIGAEFDPAWYPARAR